MTQRTDNSGALFKSDRKEKDTHPDYTGQMMVDGVEYWLSGWLKEKDGRKYFSLAVKPKEERSASQTVRREPASAPRQSLKNDMDDEIPFAPEFR